MKTRRNVWLIVAAAVLALSGLACGLNIPKSTPTIPPTAIPPTETPTQAPLVTFPPATLPPVTQLPSGPYTDMIGSWLDPDTSGTVTTIMGLGGGLTISSVVNPDRGGNEYFFSNWQNDVLSWVYCVPKGACFSTSTTSVSGDQLVTNWQDDSGNSGTTTFQRVSAEPAINYGPVDGMANRWVDPGTGTEHLIVWENNEYLVAATYNPDRGTNEINESSWANNVLTWTYCVPQGPCVTSKTTSVTYCSLETTWTNTNGDSGNTTMECMP